MAAVRRVFQESPVLQVHASQAARKATHDLEDSFALALAKDVKAEATRPHASFDRSPGDRHLFDAVPRSRAAPPGRRKAREDPGHAEGSGQTSLNLLEKGIGDYGAKPRCLDR